MLFLNMLRFVPSCSGSPFLLAWTPIKILIICLLILADQVDCWSLPTLSGYTQASRVPMADTFLCIRFCSLPNLYCSFKMKLFINPSVCVSVLTSLLTWWNGPPFFCQLPNHAARRSLLVTYSPASSHWPSGWPQYDISLLQVYGSVYHFRKPLRPIVRTFSSPQFVLEQSNLVQHATWRK